MIISELLPEAVRQPALRGELDRSARAGTIRILSAGAKDAAWKLRAEHLSPRWDERPRIKSGSAGLGRVER